MAEWNDKLSDRMKFEKKFGDIKLPREEEARDLILRPTTNASGVTTTKTIRLLPLKQMNLE